MSRVGRRGEHQEVIEIGFYGFRMAKEFYWEREGGRSGNIEKEEEILEM